MEWNSSPSIFSPTAFGININKVMYTLYSNKGILLSFSEISKLSLSTSTKSRSYNLLLSHFLEFSFTLVSSVPKIFCFLYFEISYPISLTTSKFNFIFKRKAEETIITIPWESSSYFLIFYSCRFQNSLNYTESLLLTHYCLLLWYSTLVKLSIKKALFLFFFYIQCPFFLIFYELCKKFLSVDCFYILFILP